MLMRLGSNGLETVKPTNDLKIGQIIWLNGYGQSKNSHDRLAIFRKSLNGYFKTTDYETVNLQTYRTRKINANEVRHDSEIFGIGLYYTTGDIVSEKEINKALSNVRETKIKDKEAAEANKEREKKYIKEIEEKYKHLIKTDNKTRSYVTAAKNIRKELKKAFPDLKFSVRSSSYTGGDSVRIDWTNGVTEEEVEKITDKYQNGSFDGMQDIYNYSNDPFNSLFGGAKYVLTQRRITMGKYREVAKEYGVEIDDNFNFSCDYQLEMVIRRKTRK